MGIVELNPREVALLIGQCTEADVAGAIEFFTKPDPQSETKKEEGRRLVRMSQYVYRVVNFMEYRNRVSNSLTAVKNRQAVARHYRKKRRKPYLVCISDRTPDV